VEAHGNATGEYVRSKPEVMTEIAERLKQSAAHPNIIYQEMKNASTMPQNRPQNKKQVPAIYLANPTTMAIKLYTH